MTCDGCPNNNFEGPRPPNGSDDPCNTSGIGIFCTGSYWYYNPELSLDTDLYGDCPRLFIRMGDLCGVNEWLEITTPGSIISADAPTDTDCCVAGTIWIRPASLSGLANDEIYISYADFSVEPPICRWCSICGDVCQLPVRDEAPQLTNIVHPGGGNTIVLITHPRPETCDFAQFWFAVSVEPDTTGTTFMQISATEDGVDFGRKDHGTGINTGGPTFMLHGTSTPRESLTGTVYETLLYATGDPFLVEITSAAWICHSCP